MAFQTEYEFNLPKGYVDENGELHKTGVMRLATAADEILPMRDPRVQQNPQYLTVIILSRVITKLGSLQMINTRVIEGMYSTDFTYLQNLYQGINSEEMEKIGAVCPKCSNSFEVEINQPGEV